MPYFPELPEPAPYKCPGCNKWFAANNVSCGVYHSPGTCCHEYEEEVNAPNPR